jgi:hypothetical protein
VLCTRLRVLSLLFACGIVTSSVACGSGASKSENAGDGDHGQHGDGDGSGDGDTMHPGDGDTTQPGDGDAQGCQPPGETDIRFPMVVDGYYFVTGYTGDGQNGHVVEGSCAQRGGDKRGYCHAFTYDVSDMNWGGVFWQYPEDNWGDRPGRTIPEGATQISFYAWSDAGGEEISFGAGIKDKDAFNTITPMTLSNQPQKFTVSLAGMQTCSDVVSGFVWSAAGQGKTSITFYVDDIVWEGENKTTEPDPGSLPSLDTNWPDSPGAQGVALRVRNFCPFPLFIGGGGSEADLAPARVRLGRGEYHDYDVPKVWSSARVNAFGAELDSDPREKAELTFFQGPDGNHVSYNVTYVDSLGLPTEITSVGGACTAQEHTTGCTAPIANVLDGCPQEFLRSAKRCLSPRSYCLGARTGEDYCKKLDDVIASCTDCPKAPTPDVYACKGAYMNEPRWCAALNRGMTQDPDNENASAYYQNPPFNDYSKWVHDVCPGIYAFPFDDQFAHGGYRDCAGGTEVRITFCPGF